MKNNNYVITSLKFLAVLLITNSHCENVYPPSLQSFATFGALGNALFFFLSGYALSLGRMDGYWNWIKRRLLRILPPILIWGIVSILVWEKEFSIEKLFCLNYWFVTCILIYYLFYYWILKYAKRILPLLIAVSIAITTLFFFLHPVSQGTNIYGFLCYTCYFSIMLMGSWFGFHKFSTPQHSLLYLIGFVTSVGLYYGILIFGQHAQGFRYYLQIASLIPLHGFIVFIFLFFSKLQLNKFFNKPLGAFITLIGSLTLEIYLVQFHILGDYLRAYFPLNMILQFIAICLVAYLLSLPGKWLKS